MTDVFGIFTKLMFAKQTSLSFSLSFFPVYVYVYVFAVEANKTNRLLGDHVSERQTKEILTMRTHMRLIQSAGHFLIYLSFCSQPMHNTNSVKCKNGFMGWCLVLVCFTSIFLLDMHHCTHHRRHKSMFDIKISLNFLFLFLVISMRAHKSESEMGSFSGKFPFCCFSSLARVKH